MIKNEIVPLFRQLAKDDQDSVRLLTVGACVEIAKILSDDDIQNEVQTFLTVTHFLKAPETSYLYDLIRKNVLNQPIKKYFRKMFLKNLKQYLKLAPVLKTLTEDKSWRVRYMVADRIVDLQTAVGVPLTQKDLVPAFVVSSPLRHDIQIFRINFNATYKNDV